MEDICSLPIFISNLECIMCIYGELLIREWNIANIKYDYTSVYKFSYERDMFINILFTDKLCND
jgi:hypothetical protein